MTAAPVPGVVDFWFDPACPDSWTTSRWLREVEQLRPLRVCYHVMSLYLLNKHSTDVGRPTGASCRPPRGPARGAAAAVTEFGEQGLERFHAAFGVLVSDHWRRPSAAEYHGVRRAALPRAGLPGELEEAMESDEYDAALHLSHEQGIALVGAR